MKPISVLLIMVLCTNWLLAQEAAYLKYYENGSIKDSCGYNTEKQLSGEWKSYSSNGVLLEKGSYEQGNETGEWKYYYSEGTIKTTGSFAKGEKIGTWIYYTKNGDIYNKILDIKNVVFPVFRGCEGTKQELSRCFNRGVQKHVQKYFDAELVHTLGLSPGIVRIKVTYKIDTNGLVSDIQVTAPHARLKNEAIKVTKRLPKFTPGRADGKVSSFYFVLPITLRID